VETLFDLRLVCCLGMLFWDSVVVFEVVLLGVGGSRKESRRSELERLRRISSRSHL